MLINTCSAFHSERENLVVGILDDAAGPLQLNPQHAIFPGESSARLQSGRRNIAYLREARDVLGPVFGIGNKGKYLCQRRVDEMGLSSMAGSAAPFFNLASHPTCGRSLKTVKMGHAGLGKEATRGFAKNHITTIATRYRTSSGTHRGFPAAGKTVICTDVPLFDICQRNLFKQIQFALVTCEISKIYHSHHPLLLVAPCHAGEKSFYYAIAVLNHPGAHIPRTSPWCSV